MLLTISGIRSAGGLICIRYFCCSPSKFLHCLKNKIRFINYFRKNNFKSNNHYFIVVIVGFSLIFYFSYKYLES